MKSPPDEVKLSREAGDALIERLQANTVTSDDRWLLVKLIQLYFWFTFALCETKISLKRLKRALLGEDKRRPPPPPAGGESSAGEDVGSVAAAGRATPPAGSAATVKDPAGAAPEPAAPPQRPPGHGRQGADAYTGAAWVICRQEELAAGQRCPACGRGTL